MPATPSDLVIEAERHLLASAFVDARWLAAAKRDIEPRHFAEPRHQIIWAAIVSSTADGIEADELTVTATLTASGQIEQIGGAAGLNAITATLYSPSPAVARWQQTVLDAAKTRVMRLALDGLVSKADSGVFTSEDLANEATRIAALGAPDRKKGDTGPTRFDFDRLLAFDKNADPTNVLGNRWLCRGGSCLVVAQTGAGKSALTTQAALCWALGQDFFGIKPKAALRSIVLQSENDEGDVAESVQGTMAGLGIPATSQTAGILGSRVAFYREAVRTGEEFGTMLRELVLAHQADLVFIDPLLGFAGIDLANQEQASHFLRHIIQPVLQETGVVLFSIHHTTKPPKSAKDAPPQTANDLSYMGAGSAELANWHRAVMVLTKDAAAEGQPEQPHYTLRLAKRGGRAGVTDPATGDYTTTIPLRHSREKGVIRWERRTGDQTIQANPLPIEQKHPFKTLSEGDLGQDRGSWL